MDLVCSACGAPFQSADIDFTQRIATCRYCHSATPLAQALPPAADEPKPRVPKPESLTVEDTGYGLKISRRWFTPALFFLLFFCIAWDGFLLFWYAMATGLAGEAGAFSIIFFVFPILHVAVGVGLTYFVIAGFLNTTTVEVTRGELSVRHRPIPWPGNQTLAVEQLEQLYCQSKERRGKNGTSWTFTLYAVRKNGERVKLLSNLQEVDEVRFVEQAIEEHLGIENRTIAGEVE